MNLRDICWWVELIFMLFAGLLTKFMRALMLLFHPLLAASARLRHYSDYI